MLSREHSAVVIFNGDGYSEIWHKEARRRGLPDLRTTPEALPVLTRPDVIELLREPGRFVAGVNSRARQEIYAEQYCKDRAHGSQSCYPGLRKPLSSRQPCGYQGELAGNRKPRYARNRLRITGLSPWMKLANPSMPCRRTRPRWKRPWRLPGMLARGLPAAGIYTVTRSCR